MAKVPMVFSFGADETDGAVYTVPTGKYAVFNTHLWRGSVLKINGKTVAVSDATIATHDRTQRAIQGTVCVAGYTIQVTTPNNSGHASMASGFLYDL